MSKVTLTRRFWAGKRPRARGGAEPASPAERVPRVAKLVALAIRFNELIRDGVVADQAELARLGRVTRARLTQIMNLLNLAPDIQEQVLHLSRSAPELACLTERDLRPIAATPDWRTQLHDWRELEQGCACSAHHHPDA